MTEDGLTMSAPWCEYSLSHLLINPRPHTKGNIPDCNIWVYLTAGSLRQRRLKAVEIFKLCRRQHVYTTCSHNMFTQHVHTTCSHTCSHNMFTHVHTTCSHSMFTQHVHTTCSHNMFTQHIHTTCSHMFTQHVHTACSHNMFTQHVHTTCSHNMFTQHVHTTCSHNIQNIALSTDSSICLLDRSNPFEMGRNFTGQMVDR